MLIAVPFEIFSVVSIQPQLLKSNRIFEDVSKILFDYNSLRYMEPVNIIGELTMVFITG